MFPLCCIFLHIYKTYSCCRFGSFYKTLVRLEFCTWRRMLHEDEPWHYSTINLSVCQVSEDYEIFNPFRVHPSSHQGTWHVHHLRRNAEDESRIFHFMRFHLDIWVEKRVVHHLENGQRCTKDEAVQQIWLIKPTDRKLFNTVGPRWYYYD